MNFMGVDPNSQRTGNQAKQDLATALGRPLTDAETQQATGLIGYNDPSGNSMVSGAQYNQLLKEASRLTPGSSYTDWTAPTAPAGPTGISLENPAAPTYNAPTLEMPDAYQAPDPFHYDAWRATTADDLYADPSYQNRLAEGQKAIERSRAASGLLRTGGTMADLAQYAQDYAANEFSNVDARRRADYQTGYTTAKDAYDTNTASGRYAYEQDVNRAKDIYGAASDAAQADYTARVLGWQSAREDANRARELNFDRDWQRELYAKDDAYRRERATADDIYRDRTYNRDDEYRVWLANLQNQQFLADLGTR